MFLDVASTLLYQGGDFAQLEPFGNSPDSGGELLADRPEILSEEIREYLNIVVCGVFGATSLASHRLNQAYPRLFVKMLGLDTLERMTGRAIRFEDRPGRCLRQIRDCRGCIDCHGRRLFG